MNPFSEWLGYFFRSKHRKGFGVHSPFVFYLVTKVIEERLPYYKYELVEKVREALLRTKKQLQVKTESGELEMRRISDEVKKDSLLPSYGQLLFRLVNHAKSKYLLELKASFGLSSMYMAAPDSKSQLWTIEEGDTAKFAGLSYKHADFHNIHLEEGVAQEALERVLRKMERVDFLFFNPDLRSVDFATLRSMYEQCVAKMHEGSVAVIDGIHRCQEAKTLWEGLKKEDRVRVTIDLYVFGIVYYNKELQKEDYVLRFSPSIKECLKRLFREI